jgi:hypothetical protein
LQTCFFRQFGRSVVRADYLTLRKGFIMVCINAIKFLLGVNGWVMWFLSHCICMFFDSLWYLNFNSPYDEILELLRWYLHLFNISFLELYRMYKTSTLWMLTIMSSVFFVHGRITTFHQNMISTATWFGLWKRNSKELLVWG